MSNSSALESTKSLVLGVIFAGAMWTAAGADSIVVPYTGSFNESTVVAEGGLPAGDYDTIGGLPDVGLFNLVAGTNVFFGSVFTPTDSTDFFLIGIGEGQTLTGASISFGNNLDDFNPLFASPAPRWTLEESDDTPTIFDVPVAVNGQTSALITNAPSFSRGLGIYNVLIGNGTFAPNQGGPVSYTMSFTVESAVIPLPPAGLLLIGGLGVLAALRRRRSA
jgi:hypothetical protein